jgi:hypothetical protein
MKTLKITLAFLFFAASAFAQQLEIGPTVGYWFNNIVDRNSDHTRAVIGNALWRPNYGLTALYYVKNPDVGGSMRIGALYRNSKIGSVSEINPADHYLANANAFALFAGYGGNVGDGYIIYFDAGFSYSSINNNGFYKGSNPQTQSFDDLKQDLYIKPNNIAFIYAMGVEKHIANNLKLSLELNGDAGIPKVNTGTGSFALQSLGFGVGLRYVLQSATSTPK